MAKEVLRRRGTTAEHGDFTGAEGEITVDTDKDTLVVHDGSTAGGFPLALESALTLSNLGIANHDDIDITAAGEMTNTKQPAFMMKSSQANISGAGASTTIIWDTPIFDQNSDVTSTTTFTAPVTGRYLLCVMGTVINMGIGVPDNIAFTLITSNRNYQSTMQGSNHTFDDVTRTMIAVADMDAGDTAHVTLYIAGLAGNTADLSGSTFSGVLIA